MTVLELIVFQVGQTRFAIEARHVAGMRAFDGEFPGGLRLAIENEETARALVLVDGTVLAVGEPVVARQVALDRIRPLPGPIAARIERADVRALLWDDTGLVIVADPTRHSPLSPLSKPVADW